MEYVIVSDGNIEEFTNSVSQYDSVGLRVVEYSVVVQKGTPIHYALMRHPGGMG